MSSIDKTDFSVSRGALSATGPSIGEVFTNFSKDLADRERAEKLQAQQDLLFQMKVDEAKRVDEDRKKAQAAEQALKNYTFNPADALAKQRADADTALINRYDVLNKQADDAITKAGYDPKTAANVLGSKRYDEILAKAGIANPALTEAQARGISNVYEQATPFKEDVAATVYTDLVKQGVDDKTALNRAAGIANSYESLADLQKREDDKTKLLNEASKQDFDRAVKMMDLIRKDQKDADGNSKKDTNKESFIKAMSGLGNSVEEKEFAVNNLRNSGFTDAQITKILTYAREVDPDILDFSRVGLGKPDASLDNTTLDRYAKVLGLTAKDINRQKELSPDIDVREQVLKAGKDYKSYSSSDIQADRSKVLGGSMTDKLDDIFGKATTATTKPTETKATGGGYKSPYKFDFSKEKEFNMDEYVKENMKYEGTDNEGKYRGYGQFSKDTYNEVAKTIPGNPSWEDFQKSPEIQKQAITEYAKMNAATLEKANLPVNNKTIGMMHNLGPGLAPKVLKGEELTAKEMYLILNQLPASETKGLPRKTYGGSDQLDASVQNMSVEELSKYKPVERYMRNLDKSYTGETTTPKYGDVDTSNNLSLGEFNKLTQPQQKVETTRQKYLNDPSLEFIDTKKKTDSTVVKNPSTQEERINKLVSRVRSGKGTALDQRWIDDMKKTPNGRKKLIELRLMSGSVEDDKNLENQETFNFMLKNIRNNLLSK